MKFKLAGALAIFAGILTLLVAYSHQTRLGTLFYRFITSAFLFAVIGYFSGVAVEKFVERLREQFSIKGSQLDVTSYPEQDEQTEHSANPEHSLEEADKKIS